MTRLPRRAGRIARRVAEILVPLLLVASHAGAAPQADAVPAQGVERVAQARAEPVGQRPRVQDVSDALGQRLDRMIAAPRPERTR